MKTLLGDWEDSTDVLEYHAEQATKQNKFHQNHLKENRLKLYMFWSTIDLGKVSVQPHIIAKQICFPNGNVLFLSLFSLFKNWMHSVVWGCAEILPRSFLVNINSSMAYKNV